MSDNKKPIILSEEDLKDLVSLYERAEKMPMIGMSAQDMLTGNDWVRFFESRVATTSQAWREVKRFFEQLGKKYNFNPQAVRGIDKKTGEVIFV